MTRLRGRFELEFRDILGLVSEHSVGNFVVRTFDVVYVCVCACYVCVMCALCVLYVCGWQVSG